MEQAQAAATTTKRHAPSPDTGSVTGMTATAPPAKSTKRRRIATILRIGDVDLARDAKFGEYTKSKMCGIVPLSTINDKPLLVQLSGGGRIPKAFGVQKREQGDKHVLAFSVEDKDDHSALERLRTDLSECAVDRWSDWVQGTRPPSDEMIRGSCNALVSDPRPKRDGQGEWSGLSKATIDPVLVETQACRIIDGNTGEELSMEHLPGMEWSRMILELKHVYVQSTKSYGMTRVLRYIECTGGDDLDEIVPLP